MDQHIDIENSLGQSDWSFCLEKEINEYDKILSKPPHFFQG